MKYIILFLIVSQAFFCVQSRISFNNVKNAVRTEAIGVLKGYLENGISPNMVGPTCKKSLLMWAAISGAAQAAKFLLENGADPNLTEKKTQMTALMYASKNGRMNVARVLMDYNSDQNMRNSNGKSALDIAKDEGYYDQMAEIF